MYQSKTILTNSDEDCVPRIAIVADAYATAYPILSFTFTYTRNARSDTNLGDPLPCFQFPTSALAGRCAFDFIGFHRFRVAGAA